MSFPFQPEYEIMLSAYKEAKAKIETINNPQIIALKNRVLMQLTREINILTVQLGLPVEGKSIESNWQHAPITMFLGKTIVHKEKKPENQNDGSANDYRAFRNIQQNSAMQVAEAENRAKIEDLYPQFTSIDTSQIVDSYSDLEIRTVAKWAGLPVTETNPKNTDAKYVEQIKKAIKKKNELEKAGNIGVEQVK